jgi:hypothetical protein
MPVPQTIPTLTAADRARYRGGFKPAAPPTEDRVQFPEIKMPLGGSLFWQWTAADGEPMTAKALTGRLVAVAPAETTLWPTTNASNKSRPLMILRLVPINDAGDMETMAVRVGNDYGDLDIDEIENARAADGRYDTTKIKYFRRQGTSLPRAKTTRRIAMLLEPNNLEAQPVIVTLPQMSQTVMDSILARIVDRDGLDSHPCQATISLQLRKGRTAGGGEFSCLDEAKCGVVRVDSIEISTPFFNKFTTPIEASLARELKPAAVEEPVPF